jgi:hypothetical protein
MKDESDRPIDKLINHIETWLYSNQENQKAVRPLSELLEMYRWAKQTLVDVPADMKPRVDQSHFDAYINRAYGWVKENVPPITPIDYFSLTATAGSSTGIVSNMLITISRTAKTKKDNNWVAERYDAFATMQERQDNLMKTGDLLHKLDQRIPEKPILLEEFNLAIDKAFYYRGTDLDKSVSAGIALRNLHEHYKGKLFSVAKTQPKENMTFELALNRLASHPADSLPYSILINQIDTWSQLHKKLTETAKNKSQIDIKQSAVELVAHIYTVLSLTNI